MYLSLEKRCLGFSYCVQGIPLYDALLGISAFLFASLYVVQAAFWHSLTLHSMFSTFYVEVDSEGLS
jgi:hypothetical protein